MSARTIALELARRAPRRSAPSRSVSSASRRARPCAASSASSNRAPFDVHDDPAEHLDEAPVRVPAEALVAGQRDQALQRLLVEAEVEDRVHHPGHRELGARADADEQRVRRRRRSPCPVSRSTSRIASRTSSHRPVGQLLAGREVVVAGLGRDREAGRHRQARDRHLGEAGALAAEQVAHPAVALGRRRRPRRRCSAWRPCGLDRYGCGGRGHRDGCSSGSAPLTGRRGTLRCRLRLYPRPSFGPGCGTVSATSGSASTTVRPAPVPCRGARYHPTESAAQPARRTHPAMTEPITAPAEPLVIAPDAPAYNARLVRRVDETESLAYFWVRFDGEPTPFEPGQYMTIGVMAGGKIVQRPYSVASPPAVAGTEGYEFYVRLVQGGTFTPTAVRPAGRPPDADDRAEGQVHAAARRRPDARLHLVGDGQRAVRLDDAPAPDRRPAAPGGVPQRRLVRERARLPRARRGLGARPASTR